MRIRFVQDYRVHAAGAEYDLPFPGAAEELVRQGVATSVVAAKPGPAVARPSPVPPPAPPVDRRKKS